MNLLLSTLQPLAIRLPATSRIPFQQVKRYLSNPPRPRATLFAGVLIAALGQAVFALAGPGQSAPGFGIFALVLGVILFAWGASSTPANAKATTIYSNIPLPWRVLRGRLSLVPLGIGLLFLLVLVLRLLNGSTAGSDLQLWLVAIAAVAVSLLRYVKFPRIVQLRPLSTDILVVLGLIGIFLVLNVRDLTHWYYSGIGDEYAFYENAVGVLENGISRPFSQAGIYGYAVMSHIYQAAVMALFGDDNFGWRMAQTMSIVIAIPGIYIIGAALGGRRVAILATVLFTFSHYMFAYAHTGYNNVHAVAPVVWSVAFYIIGVKRRSPILMLAAGLVGGLGFYTNFAARVAFPILILFALTQARWKRQLLDLWPVALGFLVAAVPIFAASGGDVISVMRENTLVGYSREVTGPVGSRLMQNLSINLIAFNSNPYSFHYVAGSLLDPITALLAVLGIGLSIRYLRYAPFRLLMIWFLIAVLGTGVLSPYPYVAIMRLFFVLPPLVLLASFAAIYVWDKIPIPSELLPRRRAEIGLLAVLAVGVLALNINQFWFDTPKQFHLSQEAVAIWAFRSEACGNDPDRTVIFGRATAPALEPALKSYDPGGKIPLLVDHEDIDSGKPFPIESARCVIFVNPKDDEEKRVMDELQRSHPQGKLLTFSDRANKGSVEVFVIDAG